MRDYTNERKSFFSEKKKKLKLTNYLSDDKKINNI